MVQRVQLTTSLQKLAEECYLRSILLLRQPLVPTAGTDQLATYSDFVMLVACCRLTFKEWLGDVGDKLCSLQQQWGSLETMRHVGPHLKVCLPHL